MNLLTQLAENGGIPGGVPPMDRPQEIRYRNETKDVGVQTDDFLLQLQPREQIA
jgi:hypothetical protein